MKPLKLTMSAFGPYTALTVIDMAALTEGGLYLITGDTGAGKTMIFDAIAYALYGEASGTGRKNDMLRSKYAAPETETFVELEFLHRGERYVLKRVYGRERIKRNGERVEEKSTEASLLLPDGRMVTKHKEVTAAVEALIGLDSTRFRGTAMLAQGEFREFLFADTQKRLEVLRKLFNTDIYIRFAEEAKAAFSALEQEYRLKKQTVEQYISMIECAPQSPYHDALAEVKENGAYAANSEALFDGILEEDAVRATELDRMGETAEAACLSAQGLLTKCETDRKNEHRLQQERAILASLTESIAQLEAKTAEILSEQPSFDREKEALHRLELQLPEYIRLEEAKQALADANRGLANARAHRDAIERKKQSFARKLAAIDTRLEQLTDADRAKLTEEYHTLRTKKGAIDDLLMQMRSLDGKAKALKQATDAYRNAAALSDAEAAAYAIMERAYFDGIAGLLSESLVEDAPCPVCGSTVHPCPTKRQEGVPDRNALELKREEATRLSEQAKALSARAGELNGAYLTEQDAVLRYGAELFPDTEAAPALLRSLAAEQAALLESALTEAIAKLRSAEQEAFERNRLTEQKQEMTARCGEIGKQSEDLAIAVARLEVEAKGLCDRVADLGNRLSFGGKEEAEKQLTALRTKLQAYETAKSEAEAEQNRAYLIRAKHTAAIEELEMQLQNSTADEFDALTAAFRQCTEDRRACVRDLAVVKARLERNKAAIRSVRHHREDFDRLIKRLGEVKAISDTANGTLAGKEKLTLEAFVQLRLFDRILHRAATRLMKLTNGRYDLIRRQDGGLRGKTGLDIDVLDHHNGSVRSVKSLSGGEAFKASLALALGLSDEMESECGGVVMDAMFIDEGFGSLDEESLRQAVSMLASLSDGGRSIGIISHVTELRERIDRQLVVKKTPGNGSIVCG